MNARGSEAHERAFGIVQGFDDKFPLLTPSARELLLEALEIVWCEGSVAIGRGDDLIRLQRGDVGWRVEA